MPKPTFFNLPEAKRNRIIDAAVQVFAGTHYRKVTIDSIVEEAKIPKGSFYQYFDNKDDLYTYMFVQMGQTKVNMFRTLIDKADTLCFKDYMMAFITELKRIEDTGTKMAKLKQSFINECPQEIKKKMLKSEMHKYYKVFEEVIGLYVAKDEFRSDINKKTAAYAAITCISNLEYYDFEDGEGPVGVLTHIIDLLYRMMKK